MLFYIVFTAIYNLYLQQFDQKKNELDDFTELVATHTVKIMSLFTENIKMESHQFQPAVRLIYNDVYIARVVEGCNAISVMILFAAFIFAFSARWHKTILYIFIGNNSNNYMSILFDDVGGEIKDLAECSDFKTNNPHLKLNERVYIDELGF